MLYILSNSYETLNRLKVIVMNNRMSVHILVVFLFVAFSCKSEVKTNLPVENNPSVKEAVVKTQYAEKLEAKQVEDPIKTEENIPVVKQTNKQAPKEVKTTSSEIQKPAKNNVDKGIEIEMGEGSESNSKVETSKPIVETKNDVVVIEKEIKSEVKSEVKPETDKPVKPEKVETFIGFPNHSIFDGLLKAHVSSAGVVDYAALKKNEATLDNYLTMLEAHSVETTWSRNQKLAFWINAYNAYTIKLILKNYPLASITDLNGGKPWDAKWIKLNGKTLSLNNIENDIIRPKFNEPRIHFAVNCAAKSCPPLLNSAYKPKSIDSQLESQTKKFVNNPAFNTLGKNDIKVSKIFDWYGSDFGDVASFVLRYADTTVKPSAKVTFMEYDWKLNGK